MADPYRSPLTMTMDRAAVDARKPRAGPLVEPKEAIAIALTTAEWKPGGILDPDGIVVAHVLKALHQAGWEIVPR